VGRKVGREEAEVGGTEGEGASGGGTKEGWCTWVVRTGISIFDTVYICVMCVCVCVEGRRGREGGREEKREREGGVGVG